MRMDGNSKTAQNPEIAPYNPRTIYSCTSKTSKIIDQTRFYGGGGGIRTHETLSGLTVFKTAGVNRFPTPPGFDCSVLADSTAFGVAQSLPNSLSRHRYLCDLTCSDLPRFIAESVNAVDADAACTW